MGQLPLLSFNDALDLFGGGDGVNIGPAGGGVLGIPGTTPLLHDFGLLSPNQLVGTTSQDASPPQSGPVDLLNTPKRMTRLDLEHRAWLQTGFQSNSGSETVEQGMENFDRGPDLMPPTPESASDGLKSDEPETTDPGVLHSIPMDRHTSKTTLENKACVSQRRKNDLMKTEGSRRRRRHESVASDLSSFTMSPFSDSVLLHYNDPASVQSVQTNCSQTSGYVSSNDNELLQNLASFDSCALPQQQNTSANIAASFPGPNSAGTSNATFSPFQDMSSSAPNSNFDQLCQDQLSGFNARTGDGPQGCEATFIPSPVTMGFNATYTPSAMFPDQTSPYLTFNSPDQNTAAFSDSHSITWTSAGSQAQLDQHQPSEVQNTQMNQLPATNGFQYRTQMVGQIHNQFTLPNGNAYLPQRVGSGSPTMYSRKRKLLFDSVPAPSPGEGRVQTWETSGDLGTQGNAEIPNGSLALRDPGDSEPAHPDNEAKEAEAASSVEGEGRRNDTPEDESSHSDAGSPDIIEIEVEENVSSLVKNPSSNDGIQVVLQPLAPTNHDQSETPFENSPNPVGSKLNSVPHGQNAQVRGGNSVLQGATPINALQQSANAVSNTVDMLRVQSLQNNVVSNWNSSGGYGAMLSPNIHRAQNYVAAGSGGLHLGATLQGQHHQTGPNGAGVPGVPANAAPSPYVQVLQFSPRLMHIGSLNVTGHGNWAQPPGQQQQLASVQSAAVFAHPTVNPQQTRNLNNVVNGPPGLLPISVNPGGGVTARLGAPQCPMPAGFVARPGGLGAAQVASMLNAQNAGKVETFVRCCLASELQMRKDMAK